MRLSFIPRLAAVAAALMAMAGTAGAADTMLRLSSWVPPTHLIVTDIVRPWAKAVSEATEGRVEVQILESPLGSPPAHFDIARDGLADITYGVHGYSPGRFVLTEAVELPFLADSAEVLSVAWWRVYQRMLAEKGEHRGVKLLSLWTHGPGHIFNSVRPVTRLADLDGLKFRIGGGVVSRIAPALGTVPLAAPSTKAYELLSNGVADGIFFPYESVAFFNLIRLVPYGTAVPGGLYSSSFFLVMNQRSWDRLSEADQQAIMRVSGETLARQAGIAWDTADRRGLEAMREAGNEIITMSPEFLAATKERLAFIESDWTAVADREGVDGKAVMSALRDEIAALSTH